MNILSISSILPIPGIITTNDFVFQTYIHYKQLFKDDSIAIIKPVKLNLRPNLALKKTTRLGRLNRLFTRNINGFQVEVFPFYSSWGFRNLHAIITRTVYYLNAGRIRSLFSQYNFDIIHAQYIFPDAMLAYMLHRRYKIPYVITTHNERFYFEHCISKSMAIRILKSASGIFPINHFNYSFYKSIGISNIELIPLGFSDSFIKVQKLSSKEVIHILTVAELIKLKNIDKVIYAISELVRKHPMIIYTVIGQGPEKESLLNLVESLGIANHVVFIEKIPYEYIADEMYKHDIFIMPSYFETFGRVYFEAMAMGIPIICAKNSGIYGIFKEMEEGISVDHNNISDIVNALEFLITNPERRHRIGFNGKKLVEQYTWTNIAERLHTKYIEMIHS